MIKGGKAMEITLEKIELVKDRTGVTYAEAKKALEDADGSVVDAIIAIEETVNTGEKGRGFGERGEALFESLKNLVKKGNVAKIQVKKDEEIILNVPVNAGIVGLCIAPLASIVAVVAAFGFKCVIEVVKTDGTIIDISDAVSDTAKVAMVKGSDMAEMVKDKSKEAFDKAKDSDFVDKAVEKGKEYFEKGMGIAGDFIDKAQESEAYAKAKETFEDAKEKVEEAFEEAKEKVEDKVKVDAEDFDMSEVDDEEPVEVEIEIEIGSEEEEK